MNKNKELECILFCEFHPIAGPKIVHQVRCTCKFRTDTKSDRQTDRQTGTQTDRQTDRICAFIFASFPHQNGKMSSLERLTANRVHAVISVKGTFRALCI